MWLTLCSATLIVKTSVADTLLVYDDFSRTGTLDDASPSYTSDPSRNIWGVNRADYATTDGACLTLDTDNASGAISATMPMYLSSDYFSIFPAVYEISLDVKMTSGSSTGWFGFGYSTNSQSSGQSLSQFSPWVLIRQNGALNLGMLATDYAYTSSSGSYPGDNTYSIKIILDTTQSDWTVCAYVNGSQLDLNEEDVSSFVASYSSTPLGENPTSDRSVFIYANAGIGDIEIDNFCIKQVESPGSPLLVADGFDQIGSLDGESPTYATDTSRNVWNCSDTVNATTDGSSLLLDTDSASGSITAVMPMYLSSAYFGCFPARYEITLDVTVPQGSSSSWLGFGFSSSAFTTSSLDDYAPWVFLRQNGALNVAMAGTDYVYTAASGSYAGGSMHSLKLVLDTTTEYWTVEAYVDGIQLDLNSADSNSMVASYENSALGVNPSDSRAVFIRASQGIGTVVVDNLTIACYQLESNEGAVRMEVGDDFQKIVNTYPAGTTYLIAAGTHRLQSVTPKDGDTFIGENGAIMKGSRVIDSSSAIANGDLYYWTGQNDLSHESAYGGYVEGSADAVYYNSELFVDDVRYTHVDDIDELDESGEWYYDEDNGYIYIYGDPSGHLVEVSVENPAFEPGYARNVTIENLIITQYASCMRLSGSIRGTYSTRLTLRNCTVYNNHSGGATLGGYGFAVNCLFSSNGLSGLLGSDQDEGPIFVSHNKIASNNCIGYSIGEEGGQKICATNGSLIEQNYYYNNGIWNDEGTVADVIRSNLVEVSQDSELGVTRAIYYEVCGSDDEVPGLIAWNTIYNAQETAVFINSSENVMVVENISFGGKAVFRVSDHDREPGLSNLVVFGNYCQASGSAPLQASISSDFGAAVWDKIKYIDYNSYYGDNAFRVLGNDGTFTLWQSYGMDANGSWSSSETPELPDWAIPFEESYYGVLPGTRTAHFRMDESSSSVIDNSAVDGADGALYGWPIFKSDSGMKAGALSFDQTDGSSDYADLGTSLGNTSEMTVSFWMKPDGTISDMIPVSKSPDDTSGAGWAFQLLDDGDVVFRVGSASNCTNVSASAGMYGTNWMHVAGTFSDGTARLYINGELIAETSGITQAIQNSSTSLRLGVPEDETDQSYNGMLDDLQIYSEALSAVEVKSLMNCLGLKDTLMCGYWPFDDVGGESVRDYDYSFNENNGTIQNDPSWVSGTRGYALDFDGSSSYVNIPDDEALLLSDDVTLSAWIYADDVTGHHTIISKGENCALEIYDGKVRMVLTLSDGSYFRAQTVGIEVTTGQLYHLGAVREGDSIRIYVNGAEKSVTYIDTRSSLSIQSNTSDIEIGRYADGSQYFDGVIDEVRIYPMALSSGEVESLWGMIDI
ncbi:LamG-like jellyroll fold domain-containing protein [Coraliomargarita parva]|uniref:LamG-like jellyroll fold domain-containing protein n=1 Tax=Coraliomargarita parva TaxID=3014050 RepID=UPI0022B4BED2|nr:LamG-like jellyroll fold domain-containing protein [Coraliomargarita parva]